MRTIVTLIALALPGAAAAAQPTLGGPMRHLLVSVFDQQVFLTLEDPDAGPAVMQDGGGLTGGAAVLNGAGYNGQYGWLSNGFISLPSGAGLFVRTVSSSPWLDVYAHSGFAPILGTDGSDPLWQWNGTMVHNWYATRVHGEHSITHEVFVGDPLGRPLDGWTSGTIELEFLYGRVLGSAPAGPARDASGAGSVPVVPAPGAVALVACASSLLGRRRR